MDDLIKRLCLRLAAPSPDRLPALAAGTRSEAVAEGSSRRGFLATMGKVAVGAAAAVAGTALFTHPAEAASLHCCEGIACPFHGCSRGMAIGYTWSCAGYFCHDCFTAHGNGRYYCTYTVARARTSTRRTAATRSSSGHANSSGYGGYGEYSSYGGGFYGLPSGYFDWG